MEEAGLGGLIGDPPVLSEQAEIARHCWTFCGGWKPERWPVYAALFEVNDWHLLIDLMGEIRQNG
jgi:hypothetical protein